LSYARVQEGPRPSGLIPTDLAARIQVGEHRQAEGRMLAHERMVFVVDISAEYLRLSRENGVLNILPLAFG
jgi:hypothetical protein